MLKLILLPGMDGTGKLFEPLANQLNPTFAIQVVQYPTDQCLSYTELERLVQSALPASQPFVILAESFSTPLSVMCAAHNPPNLKGLILCAGFVTPQFAAGVDSSTPASPQSSSTEPSPTS